jgi:hypothetical protein
VADSGGLNRLAATIGGLTAVVLAIVGLKSAVEQLFPPHTASAQQVPSQPAQQEQQEQPAVARPRQVPPARPQDSQPEPAQGSDSDYVIPNSDTRQLQPGDLQNLSAQQLRIARNEIYARHGRIFQDPALRAYFSGKSWYRAVAGSVELSPVEQTNVQLIQSFETGRGG